jgi:hypothetical protein
LNPHGTEISLRYSRSIARCCLLVGIAVASTALSRATQVEPVALPELVKRSTTVVYGTVLETRVQSESGGARIYTYITISGREFLKGGPPQGTSITFRQLGGQVGDQVVYVPGTPRFHQKQEVLLFLTGEDAGGYPQVMGIFQGALQPVSGPGGERRVEGLGPDGSSSLLPDPAQGAGRENSPALGGSFTDFLQRIRDLVKAQAGGPKP